uniref:Uncharacterized protein n=1 Tax=Rhizophora mucronata TaxID=61149 RepID=A0A2P2PWI0_RHIMU
MASREKLF